MPPKTKPASPRPAWLRDPPNEWNEQTLDRDGLRAAAKALRLHPDFQQAQRIFAGNMLEAFESHRPLNKLLRGEGQLAFVGFVLMLHHTRDPGDPASGVTYTRISELFGHLKLASPTLIKAILVLARLRGQLHYRTAHDKRLRVMEPTEKLTRTMDIWFKANLDAVAGVESLPATAGELANLPGLLGEVMTYCCHAYTHNGFILPEDYPPLRTFMARDHGYLILMAIIQSMRVDSGGRILAAAPAGELALRLSVSRGTVRNMLKAAHERGWVTRIGRGSHELEVSTDFADICAGWMSLEFTWMAGLVRLAVATLGDKKCVP